jgi:ribosomal protein S12 methylthiotransferase
MQGARELNLVAQDLAHYGRDRRDGIGLPQVLDALVTETSVPWLRMLYVYSAGLTPALLDRMARHDRVVKYLDMPIQHGSDAVLARMRRPERGTTIRQTVARVRDAVPGVAIRTTCIVGFPGETDEDFARLLELLEEVQFERVGAFTYSAQDGTRAAEMADDVPEPVKRERLERLLELQRAITAERYEQRLGAISTVLVDREGQGRLPWQADDIDGITYLDGVGAPGDLVEVVVEEIVDDFDFRASVRRVILPAERPLRVARSLPMMATTIGSYGK